MLKPCLDCGALSDQSRCRRHRGDTGRGRARSRSAQAKFRRVVLARAGVRCQGVDAGERCAVIGPHNLHAHHTEPGNNDPATGLALCERHDLMIDPRARPRQAQ